MAPETPADILVVDDRPEQRLALATVLSDLDANVIVAASGREALRWLLQREFAVILLDVNMPDMDGFETAALIRERKRSEHTPIIFVTAYSDDAHEARGYSLGAVDYILTPVEPQALRAKVSVFVELFRMRAEITQQAESLRRNTAQLRRLADTSLSIHGAGSIEQLLEIATAAAGSLIGAAQTGVEVSVEPASLSDGGGAKPLRHVILRPQDSSLAALGVAALGPAGPRAVRISRAGLAAHPQWGSLTRGDERPPLHGWLAVPLVLRDGRTVGVVQLSEKLDGDFTAEDESLLALLVRKVSLALENTLYSQAEEANRLKDEFLATLSHELRTPLQAMLSWARMLRDEKVDAPMLERGLEVIERSARTQAQLIDDLLDVSRIMSDKLRLELEPVSLRGMIECAIEDARPAAAAQAIQVTLDLQERPLVVNGDASRLQQVMGNLLSNAIKFTPRGGRVSVMLTRQANEAVIQVIDTGEGIRPDFLPFLFERFRQADSANTRAHGGLGIGLAIVRHLVDLHRGSVHAQSAGEGKGATFSVRLPLARRGDDEALERQRDAALGDEAADSDALSGLRILLVDDHEDARECLALMLRGHGAEVLAVGSTREALEQLDRERADVLLSDIAMPGEDGHALIQKIRARSRESGGRIPAAALSAYARADDANRALRAGFDLHLAKPVRAAVLVHSIRNLAQRAHTGR